jgi:hypothetical protein
MTELDEMLRRDLHQLADSVTVPAMPVGPQYRAVGRSRRTPTLAVAATVAVIATVAALLVTIGRGATGVPPAEGGPAAWPTRGPLAGDTALIDAAVRTWEAAPLPASELPHRDVHALYAGKSVAGKTVVLTGIDARGYRRIVWLNTDPTSTTPFRHRLHLVADVLAPTGDDAGLIGFYRWRPTPRPTQDHVVIAIAAPGTTNLQWRDQFGGWRTLPSRDGAGMLVHPHATDLLDVTVRAGDEGGGVRILGDGFPIMGPIASIDHESDPGTPVEDTSETSCDGNMCVTKLDAPSIGATGRDGPGWGDLRSGYMRQDGHGQALGGWPEFAPEAELMATSLRQPATAYGISPAWSQLLPDATGLYLYNWQPDGSTHQLVLYVDRPEWFGGRLGASVEGTNPVAGIATVVPSTAGRQLVVVVADHLEVLWRSGDVGWQPMSIRHNVAMADVSGIDPSTIRYRATDSAGAVVQQGHPSTTAL